MPRCPAAVPAEALVHAALCGPALLPLPTARFRAAHPQAQGYVARSAYKLLEIQQKHKLIPPGGQVLQPAALSAQGQLLVCACRWASAAHE